MVNTYSPSTFQIIAINGVTGPYQIDSYQPSATVTTTTKDIAVSPRITASPLVEKGHQSASSVAFEWQPPYPLERGSVLEYKTYLTNVESKVTMQNTTVDQGIILEHLEPGTRYSFQVSTNFEKKLWNLFGSCPNARNELRRSEISAFEHAYVRAN